MSTGHFVGGLVGVVIVALIGIPLWPHPPSTVPMGLILAGLFVGACLGGMSSR